MSTDRSKRVKTLKNIIITCLSVLIVTPWIMCIIIFGMLGNANRKLDALTKELDEIRAYVLEQPARDTAELSDVSVPEAGEISVVDDEYIEVPEGVGSDIGLKDGNVNADDEYAGYTKVYLTFDDGPSSSTEKILDILDQYDVKATFFVVGNEDEGADALLNEIVKRGHTIAMHSYTHKYSSIYKSVAAFSDDFNRIHDHILDVTGVDCKLYRFPGGSSNTVSKINMNLFADYLDEQGVTFFDWNVSSGDAAVKMLSASTIVSNCTKNITDYDTAVVLMHDSGAKRSTVEALPTIIENILAQENTVILPITENTVPVQHISR